MFIKEHKKSRFKDLRWYHL